MPATQATPAAMSGVTYGQVERRRGLSLKDFKREYFNRKPVIVEDLSESWKARQNWTLQSLKARFGDSKILAYGYENGKYKDSLTRTVTLGEYIDKILVSDFDSYPYYGRDNFDIFKQHKEMWDDFSEPKYCFDWFRVIFPSFMLRPGPRLFIGPKGATTNLHQDMWGTHFWLSQLDGRKHWVLYPPDEYEFLRSYCWDIRPDNPDLKRYPEYRKVKAIECILGAGETIIVPRGWVHWVTSLDPTVSLTHNYMGPGNFWPCITGQLRWTLSTLKSKTMSRNGGTPPRKMDRKYV
ncbi:MAG TPA: cupin-like domain-containing protein [Terriglobales bacterium]|nr:cupin-like domain-containing protein [Terriglobales bacterium]